MWIRESAMISLDKRCLDTCWLNKKKGNDTGARFAVKMKLLL